MQLSHHPQARSLLEAIHAQPEDDLVRLVFADWLEEHGQLARAEFIRVQCERARLPSWDRRALELSWREQDLLDEHGHLWFAEAPVLPGVFWAGFERGFLSHIHVPDLACLATNAEILRSVPGLNVDVHWIRRDEVSAVPVLPNLHGLKCIGNPETHSFPRLLGAPWAESLVRLDLGDCCITEEDYCELCRVSTATRLQSFSVGLNDIRPEHVELLFAASWFASVSDLHLDDAPTYDQKEGDAVAQTLAAQPAAARLRLLSLTAGQISWVGLLSLLSSPHLMRLTSLFLDYSHLEDLQPGDLSDLPARPDLAVLGLSNSRLPGQAIPSMLTSPPLANLRSLELSDGELWTERIGAGQIGWPQFLQVLRLHGTGLRSENVVQVLSLLPWEGLHSLYLAHDFLPDEALEHLARWACHGPLRVLSLQGCLKPDARLGAFAKEGLALQELDLRENQVDPEVIRGLAQFPHLRQSLRRLSLNRSLQMNDAALADLFAEPWPELRELQLRACKLTDAVTENLGRSDRLPKLTRLNLSSNPIGPSGMTRLLASSFSRRLTCLSLNNCELDDDILAVIARWTQESRLRILGVEAEKPLLRGFAQLADQAGPSLQAVSHRVDSSTPERHALDARFPGRSWAFNLFLEWDYGD